MDKFPFSFWFFWTSKMENDCVLSSWGRSSNKQEEMDKKTSNFFIVNIRSKSWTAPHMHLHAFKVKGKCFKAILLIVNVKLSVCSTLQTVVELFTQPDCFPISSFMTRQCSCFLWLTNELMTDVTCSHSTGTSRGHKLSTQSHLSLDSQENRQTHTHFPFLIPTKNRVTKSWLTFFIFNFLDWIK